MQSLKYIWRNVRRNKLRSLLTMMSIGFSLALLTILTGYLAMQDQWGNDAQKYNRIVVMNIQGFAGAIPMNYVDRVRGMEGIDSAVPFSWFGGMYKDQQMAFAQFGTDPKEVFNVWSEYKLDPDQLKEFQTNRQACVADRKLADRMKWKLGERIPLKGTFFDVDLDLKLVGLFDCPTTNDSLWFDIEYLHESLKAKKYDRQSGNAGTVFAKVKNSSDLASFCKAIDDRFANSEDPTRTQTEAAFAQMFTDMLGNIRLFVMVIGLVVVFALTLVTATAMAMSMRERTTEIAVLKALGFTRGHVLWFVLGEACWISLLGGIFGIGFGCFSLEGLHNASAQFVPLSVSEFAGPWMLALILVAIAIGLVGGVVPAILASKRPVIDGLRRVI